MKRYSLGCAFSLDDLFDNFPYKKLDITCKECKIITGDNHRDTIVKRIFMESVRLVINDIIDNNVTFWLPLTGGKKCNIHIRRVQGEEFKNLRKAGKWKDVDILKSMFSGYQISFFMLGRRTPRIKSVYLNKQLRDRITKNANNGVQYGDSKNDTTISDYYQQIYMLFPDVTKADINRILNFSWKSLYLHNSYGGDTLISGKNFWCYIGNLKKDSLEHFYYYIRKLTVKLRVLYRRRKIQWDGYYYFALSDSQYQSYIQQKNQRGRPRKYFDFGTVFLYQILDECKINEHYKRYIFRIPYISRLKIKQFVQHLVSDKAEMVLIRDPLKFKDILVSDNEYEFL